jgi:alanine-synthesizing transaminase
LYAWLNPQARVLGPNPAYPTHAAMEAAHAHSAHLTYSLNPDNGWLPDVNEIRTKVADTPEIAGLLIINPDNPTGVVYPRHLLEEFVAIAKEYKLFLIADEIYSNLTYTKGEFTPLAELSDGVPTVIMRGLSKEIPWPGSRCGWAEFYNVDTDPDFALYIRSIEEAKMAEVCSTTLPQTVFPAIFGDDRYREHLHKRRAAYKARATKATAILDSSPQLHVVEPKGAFYLVATFTPELMKRGINKPVANPKAQKLLDAALTGIPAESFDKRFCHQLLATTGICTVPLTTGFNSRVQGFRMTLLEADDAVFTRTLEAIKDFVAA